MMSAYNENGIYQKSMQLFQSCNGEIQKNNVSYIIGLNHVQYSL